MTDGTAQGPSPTTSHSNNISLFTDLCTRFCKNANNLAELIFILNRRTQCSHKRRLPLVISQIDFRTVFEKQRNNLHKPYPRRAVQRCLALVIARIHICATRDQIPDAINIAAAIAASLKNNRRPLSSSNILCPFCRRPRANILSHCTQQDTE